MQDSQHNERILVVEDSRVQAEILKRILVKHGFAVDHALDGAEGLAKIKAARPDLVISDVVMPEMNGFELCKKIRGKESLKGVPVIFLTVLSGLEDVLEGLAAGADNFIIKPYDEARLLALIHEQLARRKPLEFKGKNGLVVTIGGQQYAISESPEKILNFFLSTYGIAMEKKAELTQAKVELENLNRELEQKVQERARALMAETSQRQQAEEELDRSRRYQELILNSAGEGIVGLDLEGRIIFANPAAVKMLGYEPEVILGQPFDRACSFSQPDGRPLPEGEHLFRATLRDGQTREMEGIYRRQGGTSFSVQATCSAIAEGEKISGAVITFGDITEHKRSEEALRRSFAGAVKALAHTVEVRDPYTSGHQLRVATLACAIAREMGLSEDRIEVLKIAGALHDIGKIQVPAGILSKPSRLSNTEFALIKTHPRVGYDIVKAVEFPGQVADILLQHHERLDGSGYPAGLQGEEFLLEARILAVADVVEAMVSHRPYRPALGMDKALEEIGRQKGILYDPQAVEACIKLCTEDKFSFD